MAGVALASVPLDLRCPGSGTSSLKPGMSVADVGAGGGEVTVALAAEVGPSGRVFSSDIDTDALEQIRARVAAAALQNVTVMQAHARDTG
jgi:precorrin-6B methylase 2